MALPAGPYAIEVRLRKGAVERSASAGYVQRPSAEYLPNQDGAALLARISAATGGQALSSLGDLAPAMAEQQREDGLWPWLLAAVLWPIEIAVRRLW